MASEESYPKLLSLAVHELRTPASVVGGYLRMLQRDTETPLSDRQRKMVDEAEKSCARLVALIAELSEVGKIDAGLDHHGAQRKPTSFRWSPRWPKVCMRQTNARCWRSEVKPSAR